MARFTALFFAIIILIGAAQAAVADVNIRSCALTKAFECSPDDGCQEWTIPEMGLPRFVRVDLKSKTITSLDKDISRTTKIAAVERLERITVLHGVEVRGWSITLGNDSGSFALSASGDDEAFVVFGSCMNP